MRKRCIQSHRALVDLFLAPSRFLMERYLDWGIPADRIRFEDYGRVPVSKPAPVGARKKRNRLAFFGQLSHYKGINVLLGAMRLLADEKVDVHLSIHGANIELHPQDFQDEFRSLLDACGESVTFAGEYDHDELSALMEGIDWVVVPSIWWENSPLVIQEAFLHRRPVICSDIGGMAEKVADGTDGLHFRAGDPESLAEVIERAVESQDLWQKLRSCIPDVHSMDDHLESLADAYDDLRQARQPALDVKEAV